MANPMANLMASLMASRCWPIATPPAMAGEAAVQ
jgi:hypothetical protein